MMCRRILALLGFAFSASPALAEMQISPPIRVEFYVSSTENSYGLWVAGDARSGCQIVRYRADGAARAVVSQPVGDGQQVMVRLGAGFAVGHHAIHLTPMGCAGAPSAVRRVIFGKASPDHSWRASGQRRSTNVESHALR